MDADPLYRRILSGEAGSWAAPLRAALTVASWGYAAAIAVRNSKYDRPGSAARCSVPVISVGNITAGGVGKTPFVIDLLQRLQRMGRRPAVIARGYGAPAGESNDEERLIRKHVPHAICVIDPDRVRGADRAVGDHAADVVVLDDGFQHRRLHRDLDLVLLDATCPFGYDRLLPRGLLREPVAGLRRADAVILTRCDQVPDDLQRTRQRVRLVAPNASLLQCRHGVTGVERLDGVPVDGGLRGRRAFLIAAVGNPATFRATVSALGAAIVGWHWWSDHHAYTPRDLASLRRRMVGTPQAVLVTTEKDAVKLSSLPGLDPASILVVRVAIEMDEDSDAILDHLLTRALAVIRR